MFKLKCYHIIIVNSVLQKAHDGWFASDPILVFATTMILVGLSIERFTCCPCNETLSTNLGHVQQPLQFFPSQLHQLKTLYWP